MRFPLTLILIFTFSCGFLFISCKDDMSEKKKKNEPENQDPAKAAKSKIDNPQVPVSSKNSFEQLGISFIIDTPEGQFLQLASPASPEEQKKLQSMFDKSDITVLSLETVPESIQSRIILTTKSKYKEFVNAKDIVVNITDGKNILCQGKLDEPKLLGLILGSNDIEKSKLNKDNNTLLDLWSKSWIVPASRILGCDKFKDTNNYARSAKLPQPIVWGKTDEKLINKQLKDLAIEKFNSTGFLNDFEKKQKESGSTSKDKPSYYFNIFGFMDKQIIQVIANAFPYEGGPGYQLESIKTWEMVDNELKPINIEETIERISDFNGDGILEYITRTNDPWDIEYHVIQIKDGKKNLLFRYYNPQPDCH